MEMHQSWKNKPQNKHIHQCRIELVAGRENNLDRTLIYWMVKINTTAAVENWSKRETQKVIDSAEVSFTAPVGTVNSQ